MTSCRTQGTLYRWFLTDQNVVINNQYGLSCTCSQAQSKTKPTSVKLAFRSYTIHCHDNASVDGKTVKVGCYSYMQLAGIFFSCAFEYISKIYESFLKCHHVSSHMFCYNNNFTLHSSQRNVRNDFMLYKCWIIWNNKSFPLECQSFKRT